MIADPRVAAKQIVDIVIVVEKRCDDLDVDARRAGAISFASPSTEITKDEFAKVWDAAKSLAESHDPLVLAAIAVAADIMDSTDPDDRRESETALCDLVKVMIDRAIAGDAPTRRLLEEGEPSWKGTFNAGD